MLYMCFLISLICDVAKIQVYFKPMTKKIGSEKRAVWDLKIGNIGFIDFGKSQILIG